MKISEIFRSIQGETSYSGLPCIFVRFAGCNLRCGYCDSARALETWEEIPVSIVLERISSLGPGIVTLTGGEPLLQEEALRRIVKDLLSRERAVLVETNGSLPLSMVPRGAVRIMDIKCPSSGMSDRTLWDNIGLLAGGDEVKFVLGSGEDYEWARGKVRELGLDGRCGVLFSPVWGRISPAYIAERLLADGLNVRLQVQLHKVLWGERSGV